MRDARILIALSTLTIIVAAITPLDAVTVIPGIIGTVLGFSMLRIGRTKGRAYEKSPITSKTLKQTHTAA